MLFRGKVRKQINNPQLWLLIFFQHNHSHVPSLYYPTKNWTKNKMKHFFFENNKRILWKLWDLKNFLFKIFHSLKPPEFIINMLFRCSQPLLICNKWIKNWNHERDRKCYLRSWCSSGFLLLRDTKIWTLNRSLSPHIHHTY